MRPRSLQPGGTLWSLLVFGCVVATAFGALAVSGDGLRVAAWWPVAGLSTALLARTPFRSWSVLVPGIAVSHLSALLLNGRPVDFAIVYGSASVLAAVAGALVLRHRRREQEVLLRTQWDLLRLGLAAIAAAAVMVVGGVVFALSQGDPPPSSLWSLAISHVASLLVLVPPLTCGRGTMRRFRVGSLVIQSGLLALAILVVFAPGQYLAYAFLPMPLLTWAAHRFGLGVVSWQILLSAVAVNLMTADGDGPFALSAVTNPETDLLVINSLTQAYLACMALICLPVAISVHASDVLHRQLRASRELGDMMLSTTGCMILVSDIHGTVLRANPAVTTILGHRLEDVIGRPIWETIVFDRHRDLTRQMFTVPDGSGLPDTVDGRVPDVEGKEHRVMWSSGIVHDEDGDVTHIVMTGLDVTAERNAAGLMEHLLGAALDTAIIGMDPHGRITLFNTGAQKMLGLTAFEGVGTRFTDLLDQACFTEWAARGDTTCDFTSLVSHLVDAAPQDWEWRTTQDGGQSRRVSMTLSEIRDHQEVLIGYLCVGTDVTETHATAELLVNALEKERQVVGHLKALDSAKDQFVSTVSHELRTPVSTIIGYGEMLSDGALGHLAPRQVKALEAITRNGERLVDLVDNLLALSGLATESPTWDRDPVDLCALLDDVRTATSRLVGDRDLVVTVDGPTCPVRVVGDRATLLLALTNLMSNAVKFTPDGGQVRCHLDVLDHQARLMVHDTGLGIPTDELPHVFERFWRSSTSQTREIQGTGLGMPTVLTVVTAHGGTVTVDSAHLAGTTVTVMLPLADPDPVGELAPGA